MEKRELRVTFCKVGGNSGKNTKKTIMTIPISWIKLMGMSEQERTFEAVFDGSQIILKKFKGE